MATTNILQWNPSAVNQENDATYAADSQRSGGATNPSIFEAELANKAFYQWSTYIAGLFQAFAAKGFTTSDSNLSSLTAQCANFLTTADLLPAVQVVPYAATVTLNAAQANGFYIQTMAGNLNIAAVPGLTSGQLIAMYYQQDATGGRTVTFPSVMVGALQPDYTANSISAQLFGYDAQTGFLRAIGPLLSSAGTYVGNLHAGTITLSSGAPLGQVLTGNGTNFVAAAPIPLAYNPTLYVVTGIRALSTLYQNTTGLPMVVRLSYGQPSSGTVTLYSGTTSLQGTTQIVDMHGGSGGTGTRNVSCAVPIGSYYSATTDTDGSLVVWTETY